MASAVDDAGEGRFGSEPCRTGKALYSPYGNSVSSRAMNAPRYDPLKDAANREKHRVSLTLGDRLFEDDGHVIVPSIREIDGEERFKVIGAVGGKLFTGVFVWRGDQPRFMSVRRSNTGEERAYRAAC
ncbi:BrnT family toxin [Methylobacterium sp. J-068]|uniref:BrnT family toxin n=1 Tax=Methylobacterium sp. J-068 TaxID=2836649 RepID=UPI001FBAA874|nr:BrnT family toxin [Methylobacterium sp. J-068]MCJ2033417.1 BrnT family toxin [Methylobacterium sp. J-068]